MNSRVIIHVGLQKTASTYLQQMVFPQLKGITYIGRPYTQENHAFNLLQYADDALYDGSAFLEEIARIESVAGEDGTVLISDELFSGYAFYNCINRGIVADRLSRALSGAEIVLFLRGQTDLIMSLYSQFVKNGWFEKGLDESFLGKPGSGFPLERWLQGDRDWNLNNRFISHRSVFSTEHFRYSSLYSLYNDLFKRVHVFLYEDFRENRRECLGRFCSILSTELPSGLEQEYGQPVNQRLDTDQLRAKIVENRLSHIEPLPDQQSREIIASMILENCQTNDETNRTYVRSLLDETGLYRDNHALNARLNLGMENYPAEYLGSGI